MQQLRYKLKGQVLTAKALVSIDCSRDHAPVHKFRDPCDPEMPLWHLAIQLSDNGLDLYGASMPPISEEDCLRLFPY